MDTLAADQVVQEEPRTIEALLLDRNRIARLVVAVDPRQVDAAIAAAVRVVATGSLFAAAVGIERISLHEERIDIVVVEKSLLRACGIIAADDHTGTITLSAPVERVRRGHELKLVIPGDRAPNPSIGVRDERLVSLLSEAIEARRIILAAPERPLREIATIHGRCRKRLAKLLRLSWLAPEVVQTILDGGQPTILTAGTLLEADLPIRWRDQRVALGL